MRRLDKDRSLCNVEGAMVQFVMNTKEKGKEMVAAPYAFIEDLEGLIMKELEELEK